MDLSNMDKQSDAVRKAVNSTFCIHERLKKMATGLDALLKPSVVERYLEDQRRLEELFRAAEPAHLRLRREMERSIAELTSHSSNSVETVLSRWGPTVVDRLQAAYVREDLKRWAGLSAMVNLAPELPKLYDSMVKAAGMLEEVPGAETLPSGNDIDESPIIECVTFVSEELIARTKKDPAALLSLKSREFEELIATLMEGFGWEVELTKQTRDGGHDMFAVRKDELGITHKWIVECKHSPKQRKVGVGVIRSLFGTKPGREGAGLLLATTSYFSKDARELKDERYNLELKDRDDVTKWIGEWKPTTNGTVYVPPFFGDEDPNEDA